MLMEQANSCLDIGSKEEAQATVDRAEDDLVNDARWSLSLLCSTSSSIGSLCSVYAEYKLELVWLLPWFNYHLYLNVSKFPVL